MVEICADGIQSAINAQAGGAGRVELCSALEMGGLTPSAGTILHAREQLHIKLNVLIRPRAGDFLYSETEMDLIRKDIEFCHRAGCDGIVIGLLEPNGKIDTARTAELVKLADPMPVTFHRAFDMCRDPFTALEDLKTTGVNTILTSGQQSRAMDGLPLIKALTERAQGNITIMPGAGINHTNILHIAHTTGADTFHLSAARRMKSMMTFSNPSAHIGKKQDHPENDFMESDTDEIRKVVGILEGYLAKKNK